MKKAFVVIIALFALLALGFAGFARADSSLWTSGNITAGAMQYGQGSTTVNGSMETHGMSNSPSGYTAIDSTGGVYGGVTSYGSDNNFAFIQGSVSGYHSAYQNGNTAQAYSSNNANIGTQSYGNVSINASANNWGSAMAITQ